MVFFKGQLVRIARSFKNKKLYFAAGFIELLQGYVDFVRIAYLRRKIRITSRLKYIISPKQKEKQFLTVK